MGEERPLLSHPRGTVHRGSERTLWGPPSPCADTAPPPGAMRVGSVTRSSSSSVGLKSHRHLYNIHLLLITHSVNIYKAFSMWQTVDHTHGIKKHSFEREAESRVVEQKWNRGVGIGDLNGKFHPNLRALEKEHDLTVVKWGSRRGRLSLPQRVVARWASMCRTTSMHPAY